MVDLENGHINIKFSVGVKKFAFPSSIGKFIFFNNDAITQDVVSENEKGMVIHNLQCINEYVNGARLCGVYLHRYYPLRRFETIPKSFNGNRISIWGLKDGLVKYIDEYTAKIKIVLDTARFSNLDGRTWLLCVPSSDPEKENPVYECIRNVCADRNLGKFIDGTSLFKRKYKFKAAHKSCGSRPTYEEEYASICVSEDIKISADDKVIILDYIMTTGTQLSVCINRLRAAGVNPDMISVFPLSRTV